MHPFPLAKEKIRGVPRRLRALQRWAAEFDGNYPPKTEMSGRFWNDKIPVEHGLVESRHTTIATRKACAQQLINACSNLIKSKPSDLANHRITVVICLPDMFTSEVCIYLDNSYFLEHTAPCKSEHGSCSPIIERRLSQEWGLHLPQGIGELGVALDYRGYDDKADWFVGERWYFGEVGPRPNNSFKPKLLRNSA